MDDVNGNGSTEDDIACSSLVNQYYFGQIYHEKQSQFRLCNLIVQWDFVKQTCFLQCATKVNKYNMKFEYNIIYISRDITYQQPRFRRGKGFTGNTMSWMTFPNTSCIITPIYKPVCVCYSTELICPWAVCALKDEYWTEYWINDTILLVANFNIWNNWHPVPSQPQYSEVQLSP